jgi:hypothetical protein
VSVVKSLWASIQGDPVLMRRINGWLTIFWIVMIPVSIALGLLSSVVYVSALSLWALVSGHWSAWQAARVEVEQQAEAKEAATNPVEERVVEKIVADTEINRAGNARGDSPSSIDAGLVPTPAVDEILARLKRIERSLHRGITV